ncbi:MAG TPA: hypothetical protein VI318_05860 [Baekduia sp.]
MKIGVVYMQDFSNSYYRALWPMVGLQQRGHEVEYTYETSRGHVDVRPLEWCDVVHVYRSVSPLLARELGRLRRQGTAVIYDNDDDARLLPMGSPNYKDWAGARGEKRFRPQIHMMQHAALVTTTTDALAARFGQVYGGPIEIVPNHLAPTQFVREQPEHKGVLIGWVAGKEHRADAQLLEVTQMLRRVMDRDPRVRVETLGVRLDLDPERYHFADVVPFEELPSHIARFDLGLAPIADLPMNQARSDVKVKEYSAAGVPWVASARGSYLPLARGCGGVLVEDDGWEETLVELASSKLRRRRLRRQAIAWAQTQSIEQHLDRWESLVELASEAGARAFASGV